MGPGFESQQDHASKIEAPLPGFSGSRGFTIYANRNRQILNQDDVAVIADVALLDVIEELELRDGVLPEAEYIVLGLACGGGQQVGDGLQDGADGLGRDAFFLGLDAECGDQ